MKKFNRSLTAVLILFLSVTATVFSASETKKKAISIEDMKLWRYSRTTISDDGGWYTVLYKLNEKKEDKQKSKKEEKKSSDKKITKKPASIYGKGAETDVLYIRSSKSSKEYSIKNGSKPRFSDNSQWIAYSIEEGKKKKKKKFIELKHLKSGKTWKWESKASYSFIKGHSYLVTFHKKSLLIFNLDTRKEHYIGDVKEYLTDKKSDNLIYLIETEDKRGNGIYAYNLRSLSTKALDTGNFNYSIPAWNSNRTALAVWKYKQEKKKDPSEISLLTIKDINKPSPAVKSFPAKKMAGLSKKLRPAVETKGNRWKTEWSQDNKRIFLTLKKRKSEKKEDKKKSKKDEKPTVNVWHWKDKKLVSQQMFEASRKKELFRAVYFTGSNKLIQLTDKSIQRLYRSKDTDRWAVGSDNRSWISDWDNRKLDLYRVDLTNGKKTLIIKGTYSWPYISPDGKHLILWHKDNYHCYNFAKGKMVNITGKFNLSFTNKEYDMYGNVPSYGVGGWGADRKSIILNSRYDLIKVFFDGSTSPVNLTEKTRGNTPVKFRIESTNTRSDKDISERYLNFNKSLILTAFNKKNKEAGYYRLKSGALKKLIFGKSSYSTSRWRAFSMNRAGKSSAVIIRKGDYRNYPEHYLTNMSLNKLKKLTRTNPQDRNYRWGHRILVNYKNDDGVQLQGILSIPAGYKKGTSVPMIVYTYEKLSDELFNYASPRISGAVVAEMQYISEGYLFFQPDIHFNIGTPHSDMLESISAGVKRVRELGYKTDKIGYQGFSFGGHAGMYISTQKNPFSAIAAGAGVSNLTQGFNVDIVRDGSNEQDYYMVSQGRLGCSPVDNTEMYLRESAVYSAKTMDTPLLLFHGTADKVVLWEHSFGFYSILRYLKKPVVFLSYRGEGHGMRKKPNRLDVQIKLKEFFDHYLKGAKAPEWLENGIPYKPEPKTDKKDKKKKRRYVPMWM